MEKQILAKNEDEKQKPFKYKNQTEAEKAAGEAQRKISELGNKAARLEDMYTEMKHISKAIVASNLVLASVLMDALGKTRISEIHNTSEAMQEVLKVFQACVSSVKDEA